MSIPLVSYHHRLVQVAGLGFISSTVRPPARMVIKGLLARGFRKPNLSYCDDGSIRIRGWYGAHPITRIFAPTADGRIPDQAILNGLRKTADKMDAKRRGGKKKKAVETPPALGHPIYVFHNNEQPKLHELLAAMPPAGGLDAYLADMSASKCTACVLAS